MQFGNICETVFQACTHTFCVLHAGMEKPQVLFFRSRNGSPTKLALSVFLSNGLMSLLAGSPLIRVSDGVSLREEAGCQGLSPFLGGTSACFYSQHRR